MTKLVYVIILYLIKKSYAGTQPVGAF